MSKVKKISLPSNVSFRRSIDNSDGLLYSVIEEGDNEKLLPVLVEQTKLRGAMAAYVSGYKKGGLILEGDDLEKAQNPNSPNVQVIDRASLSSLTDTLALQFSVAFHGSSRTTDACSLLSYTESIENFCKRAGETGLYENLASRYFWNLINGRVLWRNGTTGIPGIVKVTAPNNDDNLPELTFNWGKIGQVKFPGIDVIKAALVKGKSSHVDLLLQRIADALSGKAGLLALEIDIRVKLYSGAEVWPSQEFMQEAQKKRDGEDISRSLSYRPINDGKRHATMHTQKIGNAIRTIDEWHDHPRYGATPVEAFGWYQKDLIALRKPADDKDAYSAFSSILETTDQIEEEVFLEKALYTLAMLIRGGVYGIGKDELESGQDKTKNKKGKNNKEDADLEEVE